MSRCHCPPTLPRVPGQESFDDDVSDADLLRQHVRGDEDAFAALVRRHRNRLWAVALRTTGNRDDAADAVQDALLSAFRNASSFRGDAQVTTWLHRIVVNACLDRIRRQQARPTVALPVDEHAVPPAADEMGRRETALVVEQALQTLPPDQRAALVLVDIEGWSVDDAAVVLQCPTGTVKSRCARARAKLAPLLSGLRNPQADDPVQEASSHRADEEAAP